MDAHAWEREKTEAEPTNTWRERRAVAFRRTNSDEAGRKLRLAGGANSCKAANFRLTREVDNPCCLKGSVTHTAA